MGVVSKTVLEVLGKQQLFCSFCGNPAEAYWKNEEEVSVCYDCAISTLPKLMADAIGQGSSYSGMLDKMELALLKIEAGFWRAAYASVTRARTSS